jgi:ATPase
MLIVPDTSVIIDGRITEKVKDGSYRGAELLIPEAVLAELEAQANRGREVGFSGLLELQGLLELSKSGQVSVKYVGRRPSLDDVKLASGGEIDAIIRNTALEYDAVLVTSDRVQAEVAKAKGLKVEYLQPEPEELRPLRIEEFFTENTMSVHLKEGAFPLAKRGDIGNQKLVQVGDTLLSSDVLKEMAHEIVEKAKKHPKGFVELDSGGATVVQLEDIRIAIARKPFSEAMEITAVRPVVRLRLEDYHLGDVLEERITKRHRGVLIAGAPGSGKSTFAASIAEHLMKQGFIVKTMESPRDLQVPAAITQYAPLGGDMRRTADVLLLVRPDYTIFDEVRRSGDFQVFADMRLAGVGMIGVVHASRSIDAIQRLIGRVELGVIPQVVDTVIYLEAGRVEKVYSLRFTVKVPEGMFEEDLARPVIVVEDFETGVAEYEIYTFGEQVVVMPVEKEDFEEEEVRERVFAEVGRYASKPFDVNVLSSKKAVILCRDADVPAILGKKGRNIDRIEKRLGMKLDVRAVKSRRQSAQLELESTKKHLVLHLPEFAGEIVKILIDGEVSFSAAVGRKGDIRLPKNSQQALMLYQAVEDGCRITVETQ